MHNYNPTTFIRYENTVFDTEEIIAVKYEPGHPHTITVFLTGGVLLEFIAENDSKDLQNLQNLWIYLAMNVQEIDFEYQFSGLTKEDKEKYLTKLPKFD